MIDLHETKARRILRWISLTLCVASGITHQATGMLEDRRLAGPMLVLFAATLYLWWPYLASWRKNRRRHPVGHCHA